MHVVWSCFEPIMTKCRVDHLAAGWCAGWLVGWLAACNVNERYILLLSAYMAVRTYSLTSRRDWHSPLRFHAKQEAGKLSSYAICSSDVVTCCYVASFQYWSRYSVGLVVCGAVMVSQFARLLLHWLVWYYWYSLFIYFTYTYIGCGKKYSIFIVIFIAITENFEAKFSTNNHVKR